MCTPKSLFLLLIELGHDLRDPLLREITFLLTVDSETKILRPLCHPSWLYSRMLQATFLPSVLHTLPLQHCLTLSIFSPVGIVPNIILVPFLTDQA
ncbi:mCG148413 [Mus musculus]|jgi:hypothetical protein|nr:mCG148413 [Mus musculus]